MSAFQNARSVANNPSDTVVVPAHSKTITISLGINFANTNYNVFLTPFFDSSCYVSDRRIDSFDISIKNPPVQDSYLSWMTN